MLVSGCFAPLSGRYNCKINAIMGARGPMVRAFIQWKGGLSTVARPAKTGRSRTPEGVAVSTLPDVTECPVHHGYEPFVQKNPFPAYAALRAEEPVMFGPAAACGEAKLQMAPVQIHQRRLAGAAMSAAPVSPQRSSSLSSGGRGPG